MPTFRAFFRILCFAFWCLICVPPQMLLLAFHRGRFSYYIPWIWHKGVCRIFGVRVKVHGTPVCGQQVLYVGNHLSYFDIPVLGSVLHASFVAKKDVANWPVWGFLSKLQQTAFIDRSRQAAARESNSLSSMIEAGRSLILFPEGTSTDGRSVLPFKSSFFALAMGGENAALDIQPFTLRYLTLNGQEALSQEQRDVYCWHRDMDAELGTHLWALAKNKRVELRVDFHPLIAVKDFQNRKVLALECHKHVSNDADQGDDAIVNTISAA